MKIKQASAQTPELLPVSSPPGSCGVCPKKMVYLAGLCAPSPAYGPTPRTKLGWSFCPRGSERPFGPPPRPPWGGKVARRVKLFPGRVAGKSPEETRGYRPNASHLGPRSVRVTPLGHAGKQFGRSGGPGVWRLCREKSLRVPTVFRADVGA